MGRRLGAAWAVGLALTACGGNPFGPDPRDVTFAEELGIDLDAMTETESGLFIRDDIVGSGAAAASADQVTLTYTGWLPDAEVFDSGIGYTFRIDVDNVILGLAEGVKGMQVGGERTVVVPPELGYDAAGSGPTPENAVRVFELILTAIN